MRKDVSIGHLVTTVIAMISVVLWLAKLDGRVTTVEKELPHFTKTDDEIKEDMLRMRQEMRADVREINRKLDQLILRNNAMHNSLNSIGGMGGGSG